MSLQVTGKNIHVGESFQNYVEGKLDDAIHKYIGKYLTAHVRVEKERGRFHTSCSVRLRTGLALESTGEGTDAYASADASFEHLEKRLRRYKRRLKNRHHGASTDRLDTQGTQVNDFVIEIADDELETGGGEPHENPLVVAETERTIHRLSVSEAVMRLDLTDDDFLVFRNASNEEINVVYRRPDGNIGWVDPASPVMGGAKSSKNAGKQAGEKTARSLAAAETGITKSSAGRSKRSS